jgi:hypothetical protein
LVYDHYEPRKKVLDAGYPVRYVMQGVVSPILAPAPTTPTIPVPVPVIVQPTQANVTILTQIVALYEAILLLIKGRNLTLTSVNYSLLKSRTFWLIVFAFLYNGYAAISGQLPASATVVIDLVFGALQSYFHVSGVQNAAVASAQTHEPMSGQ